MAAARRAILAAARILVGRNGSDDEGRRAVAPGPTEMPIYEYQCRPCGKTFEELVLRPSDEAELACPACRSREVARVMSRPAAPRTGGAPTAPARSPGCGPVG